ncbi:MAG: MerR family transcriptional regulator [Bdellovibrionaceae bacterium]|nr:MerR family transcriptional regulator [Bdellovibrionales bacterium]MCB9254278.1 MerR family transcriptional regulator [Pseudobdellovibrionaceae bacterium]
MVGSRAKPSYSVKAVCRRLGIGPHTLRAWESRYGAVEPARTEAGQRRYSFGDVERLESIVRLLNLGHSVGVVAKLTDAELHRLLNKHQPLSQPSEPSQVASVIESLETNLKRFDVHAISSLLDQKRTALGARSFVLQILGPLLGWMANKVNADQLSIAHEHALSAVVRDQIYQTLRYGSIPVRSNSAPRFVLAAPEDDLHEFGILMGAALLSHYEIPSHFFGANLPAEALASAVVGVRADIVLLSNAPVPESERRISFEEYLKVLHRLLPKRVAVWLGGAGKLPHLRRVLAGRKYRYVESLFELDGLLETVASKTKTGKQSRRRKFSL